MDKYTTIDICSMEDAQYVSVDQVIEKLKDALFSAYQMETHRKQYEFLSQDIKSILKHLES